MKRFFSIAAFVAMAVCPMLAQCEIDAGVTLAGSTNAFAPHYIMANSEGALAGDALAQAFARVRQELDTTKRFSLGYGAEVLVGELRLAAYAQYQENQGIQRLQETQHQFSALVRNAYVEAKWRSVFAVAGAKQHASQILNQRLTSGDLVMSGNALPGLGFRAGFVDFQNIPFTRGEVQIKGELGYERSLNDQWLKDNYNYYNNFITTGYWQSYKNIYFRTNPQRRLVATIGMQAASQFGGTQAYYVKGQLVKTVKMEANAQAFLHSLIPAAGGAGEGDTFVEGNHLGAYDILLEYRLPKGGVVRGYLQKPWEDGSSLGFRNGFDGLWGVEWRAANAAAPVRAVVVEYLDLTNQSGPIHYAPADHPNSSLSHQATGMDDYYNNYAYNGWQTKGLSIGSPFVKQVLYNTDGYMRYTDNVMRGWHVATEGSINRHLAWRAMASWRKSWGTHEMPRSAAVECVSAMVELAMRLPRWKKIECKVQLGFDHGKMLGNHTGGLLTVVYHIKTNKK